MPNSIEILKKEIAFHAEQIRLKKTQLVLAQRAEALSKGQHLPFTTMRANEAARLILMEVGHALPMDEIIDRAIAGGAAMGKKRGRHNVRIGIEKCVPKIFRMVGNLVGLSEWPDDKFITDK